MVDTKQTTTIGEHYATGELARRGWAPALTRDGLERTDILVVRTDGERRLIEVQVKAALNTGWKYVNWPLGEKSQQPSASEAEYLVLVGVLSDLTVPPRFFVLPRAHVAAAAWIAHQHWLTEPGIAAGKRNVPANPIRAYTSAPSRNTKIAGTSFARASRWAVRTLLDVDTRAYPIGSSVLPEISSAYVAATTTQTSRHRSRIGIG